MSSGRYTQRGYATQGLAFAGWANAGRAAVIVVPDVDSERFILTGATGQRYAINGASTARLNATGATGKRHTFTGAVR